MSGFVRHRGQIGPQGLRSEPGWNRERRGERQQAGDQQSDARRDNLHLAERGEPVSQIEAVAKFEMCPLIGDYGCLPTNQTCAIVIPCYNEELRLQSGRIAAFASAHPEIRYILVNDGSRDRTIDVLRALQTGNEDQISVIDMSTNQGKAEAVRKGMLAALAAPGVRYAGYWDADLATPLETIPDMIGVLENRPDLAMVFGARVKLLGRKVERRAIRHYLGRIFATVVSTALRLAIYDTQCGAKLFRVSDRVPELFAEPFSTRWVFDVEIIARFIRQCGYDRKRAEAFIYEYPLLEWRDVAGSRVRPKDFFTAFFDILRIYRRYRP